MKKNAVWKRCEGAIYQLDYLNRRCKKYLKTITVFDNDHDRLVESYWEAEDVSEDTIKAVISSLAKEIDSVAATTLKKAVMALFSEACLHPKVKGEPSRTLEVKGGTP